jgi:hypothetical protein
LGKRKRKSLILQKNLLRADTSSRNSLDYKGHGIGQPPKGQTLLFCDMHFLIVYSEFIDDWE